MVPPPPPRPPVQAGVTATIGRRKKVFGRVSLQPREAPADVIELEDRIRALEAVAEVAEVNLLGTWNRGRTEGII